MTGTEVGSALADANDRRHRTALAAAQNAIGRLQRDGGDVTFVAVATEAGVSRGWLYRQARLRELITRLRATPPPPPVRSPQRASDASLRQMLDVLRTEIIRLKEENRSLRDQLARQFGAQRSQGPRQRSRIGGDMSTPSSPTLTRDSSG